MITIKAYAIPYYDCANFEITAGKKYPILKITYPKLIDEGMLTIANDNGQLIRLSSYKFKIVTE